jgi:single-strand DNA-binding protein
MSMANQWVGWGNLTRDPEIRYFESGTSVANCGLAVNKRWTNKKGEIEESVDFFDLAIWADQGENVAGSLSKGDRVMVVGNLRIRRVEDPGGGAARQYPEIVVEEIGPTMRFATVDISRTPKKAKPSSSDPSHANF